MIQCQSIASDDAMDCGWCGVDVVEGMEAVASSIVVVDGYDGIGGDGNGHGTGERVG